MGARLLDDRMAGAVIMLGNRRCPRTSNLVPGAVGVVALKRRRAQRCLGKGSTKAESDKIHVNSD